MSTIIMTACWPIQGMTPVQKAVLISLADQANDDGVCWPAVATISRRTCVSERSVQSALRWLEANGFIKAHRRMGRSTWYTVTPADAAPRSSRTPADAAPPPLQMPHPTPADAAPRTVKEPSIEPSVEVDAAASPPAPADKIPYEQIRELYNRVLGGHLPRCLGLNDKHRKHIRATYNLKLEGRHVVRDGGLEFWEGLFNDVLYCPFLLGQNGRAWQADFAFLTTAAKIQAFFEGKYDAR